MTSDRPAVVRWLELIQIDSCSASVQSPRVEDETIVTDAAA